MTRKTKTKRQLFQLLPATERALAREQARRENDLLAWLTKQKSKMTRIKR